MLARLPLAERLLSPYLVAAQATPILAFAPLLALWFGPGLTAKVVICALIVFFPVAIATMVGVRAVDERLLELARSLRATRWQVVTTLEVPAALPAIFGGLRVGVTLAVVGAIVGEWVGADRGLGLLVNLARGALFDIPLMFATLLTIALLGIGLYGLVVLVGARPRSPTMTQSRKVEISMPRRAVIALAVLALAIAACRGPGEPSTCPTPPPSGVGYCGFAPTPAQGRARLHPERPVRAVLPRPAGRLLPRRRASR